MGINNKEPDLIMDSRLQQKKQQLNFWLTDMNLDFYGNLMMLIFRKVLK